MDVIEKLWRYALELGASPEEGHAAMDMLPDGAPALREDVAFLERHGGTVAGSFPTGRRRVLDGEPGFHGIPAVPGFGDLTRFDLDPLAVEARGAMLRELVAARLLEPDEQTGHAGLRRPFVTDDPAFHGHSAEREYRDAAKSVARALARAHRLASDPLAYMPSPRPDLVDALPRALADHQLREYCAIILAHSQDPELAAKAWACYRITGARCMELLSALLTSANLERATISLARKGGRLQAIPLNRPVLEAVTTFSRSRPAPPGHRQPLLPTRRGGAPDKHLVESWSDALHAVEPDWAEGRRFRAHTFRHSLASWLLAHDVDYISLEAMLGHERRHRAGSGDHYVPKPYQLREQTASRLMGWPEEWPTWMAEWDLLAPFFGLTG